MEIKIFQTKVKAILDTGAPCIIYKNLPKQIKQFKPKICFYKDSKVVTKCGSVMNPTSWVHLDIVIGNIKILDFPFRYIPNFKYEILLGHEFMLASGLTPLLAYSCYLMLPNKPYPKSNHTCILPSHDLKKLYLPNALQKSKLKEQGRKKAN